MLHAVAVVGADAFSLSMGWVGDISAEGPGAQRWRRPAGGTVATGCSTSQSPAATPSRCSSAAALG
eukprot:8590189-Alexandrium_andersonii.AAC.1